jgi:hypothetical protein
MKASIEQQPFTGTPTPVVNSDFIGVNARADTNSVVAPSASAASALSSILSVYNSGISASPVIAPSASAVSALSSILSVAMASSGESAIAPSASAASVISSVLSAASRDASSAVSDTQRYITCACFACLYS